MPATQLIIDWLEEKAATMEEHARCFRLSAKFLRDQFCDFAKECLSEPLQRVTPKVYAPLKSPEPAPQLQAPAPEPEPSTPPAIPDLLPDPPSTEPPRLKRKYQRKDALPSPAPPSDGSLTIEMIRGKIGHHSSRIVYLAKHFGQPEGVVRALVESPDSGLQILPRGWIKLASNIPPKVNGHSHPPENPLRNVIQKIVREDDLPPFTLDEQKPSLLPDDCDHRGNPVFDTAGAKCPHCFVRMTLHDTYGWIVKKEENVA